MKEDGNKIQAANLLFDHSYYREAIVLYWQVLRCHMFDLLEKNGVRFNGTREALKEVIIFFSDDLDFCSNVCFFDTIATLSEWEESFELASDQAEILRSLFFTISIKLFPNDKG